MFYTNRKHWTTAEENFVTENADKMTTAEIARKINRTEVDKSGIFQPEPDIL